MARTPITPPFPSARLRATGFTLVELIAAIAALLVVLAAGVPSMHGLMQRQRVIAEGNSLISHLHHARSHAIVHHHATAVCPSSDMNTCRNDTDWNEGWIVFRDPGGNQGPGEVDDILLAERRGSSKHIHISSSGGRKMIRYLPDGRSAGSNTTIRVCADGLLARQIIVNNAGRVRSVHPADRSPCP